MSAALKPINQNDNRKAAIARAWAAVQQGTDIKP
jgi:hypothetical protein